MTDSQALEPCPFCASHDVEKREGESDAYIACNNCGGRTGLIWFGADKAAKAARMVDLIAAWNQRPQPSGDEIERVARAICVAQGDDPEREGPFREWFRESPYRAMALAALLERLSPSERS